MPIKARSIDDYLATLNGEKRAALEKLRLTIKAAVPKVEECINYGVPAFRLGGKSWQASVPARITALITR